MKNFVWVIISAILFSACSQRFSLQKRRYNHGFYFNHVAKNTEKKVNHTTKHTIAKQHINHDELNETRQVIANTVSVENEVAEPTDKEYFHNKTNESIAFHKKTATTLGTDKINNVIKSAAEHKAKVINKSKQTLKRKDFGEAVANIYVGYLVLIVIALLITAFIEGGIVGLLVGLLYVVLFIIALAILYGIGKFIRSL